VRVMVLASSLVVLVLPIIACSGPASAPSAATSAPPVSSAASVTPVATSAATSVSTPTSAAASVTPAATASASAPSTTPVSTPAATGALTPGATPSSAVAATSAAAGAAAAVSTPSGVLPTAAPTIPVTPGQARQEERTETPTPGEEGEEGPPAPNPLPTLAAGGNPLYAAVPGADVTKNGSAATIHGSVAAGQTVYAQSCAMCHGPQGKGGVPNVGSEDGTVPPLNPIDPGFKASAKGDPATFAREIDLFIQHGSQPSGSNPSVAMIPWGDQKRLTQQQIADVEAYVMQLNGLAWPSP
jgi:mono/diheme cytochrome c family protein